MNSPFTLGVLAKSRTNLFWGRDLRDGVEDEARRVGIVVEYRAPSMTSQVKEQGELLEELIQLGCHTIAVAPCDPFSGVQVVKRLNKCGIRPVLFDTAIAVNTAIPEGVQQTNALVYSSLMIDDEEGGRSTARYHQNLFPEGREVLILDGYRAGSYSARVKGYIEELGKGFRICSVAPANFEEADAYHVTLQQIRYFPNISLIFATSDNMALGASKALKALSRSDIGISGFDGTWLGKNAVNSGLFISTFDTRAEEMGREIVRLAAATVNAPDVFLSRKLDGKLFTGDLNEKETKQTSSIRRYPIVTATNTLEEWDYEKLGETVDCPVVFGSSLEKDIAPRLQQIGPERAIIVTDETVRAIYGQRLLESFRRVNLNARIYSFKGGEESKTAPVLHELADQILTDGISKRSVIVTLGGGIVNNVAGFLAAILLRGIRFIHVPTSTMSQLDVVIGGKQAVNTRHGKNLIGTFYEPEFIYLNTQLVETLPTREYSAGLAEAVKHGLCQSKRLLDLVRLGDYRDILIETLRLKIGLIHEDPREYQRGLILLYGHTLGHAFEIASNHALNHGEAISIGMVGEAMISQKLGLCSKEFVQLHRDIFSYLRLPTELPRGVGLGRILDALSYDKKERHTDHQFCLLHDVAKPVRVNGSFRISVPERLIEEVILDLCESMEDAESVDLSRKVG